MESEVSPLTSHEVAQAVVLDGEQRSNLVAYARSRFGIESDDAQDLLQETAQAIPTPSPAVWNTINRCLRKLRACLE